MDDIPASGISTGLLYLMQTPLDQDHLHLQFPVFAKDNSWRSASRPESFKKMHQFSCKEDTGINKGMMIFIPRCYEFKALVVMLKM